MRGFQTGGWLVMTVLTCKPRSLFLSRKIDGVLQSAYFLKKRSNAGRVVQMKSLSHAVDRRVLMNGKKIDA